MNCSITKIPSVSSLFLESKGVTPVERIAAGMMLEVKTGDGMVFWPATILRFGLTEKCSWRFLCHFWFKLLIEQFQLQFFLNIPASIDNVS